MGSFAVALVALVALVACSDVSAKGTPAAAASAPAATGTPGSSTGHSLASGTRISATIQESLSSRTNKPGETLRAIVSGDIADTRGGIVIPAGSVATLTIEQLEPGSRQARPQGRLALSVSSVTVNGRAYAVTAKLQPVPHHLEGRTETTDDARRVGDVIVSAGTPIVFTLAQSLNISAR
jgi:hypothetical protein